MMNHSRRSMPQRMDPNEIKIIYLRCIGGEIGAASSLASKVGPLGLSAKKIGEDMALATSDWKGYKVTCKMIVQNRVARIEVVPSAANLIIRAVHSRLPLVSVSLPPAQQQGELQLHTMARVEMRQSMRGERRGGELSLNQVIDIARQMRHRSVAKELKGTVKEILGTAQGLGCTIDGQHPQEVVEGIRAGAVTIPDE